MSNFRQFLTSTSSSTTVAQFRDCGDTVFLSSLVGKKCSVPIS